MDLHYLGHQLLLQEEELSHLQAEVEASFRPWVMVEVVEEDHHLEEVVEVGP